jgi:hypothetical protein
MRNVGDWVREPSVFSFILCAVCGGVVDMEIIPTVTFFFFFWGFHGMIDWHDEIDIDGVWSITGAKCRTQVCPVCHLAWICQPPALLYYYRLRREIAWISFFNTLRNVIKLYSFVFLFSNGSQWGDNSHTKRNVPASIQILHGRWSLSDFRLLNATHFFYSDKRCENNPHRKIMSVVLFI